VRDCFVISSGDYERFFIDNGKRYHHIIDPRSGYPTDNGVHSTTIVTRNPATAEYLSTALMVMGIPDGMKFLEKHTDTEAIFISGTEDKPVITCTPGIVMTEKTDGTYEFTLKEYEK
jgi:thiamine biosynthesis lipoprotein